MVISEARLDGIFKCCAIQKTNETKKNEMFDSSIHDDDNDVEDMLLVFNGLEGDLMGGTSLMISVRFRLGSYISAFFFEYVSM